ncbi:interaptin [Anastrepha obliqua]|uniref:interaptin n=1 Tax=Anastrepha obliqua TaxID=95512 RepID=UPI0024096DFE|nr:interaptin [Anastrepha obliqua]
MCTGRSQVFLKMPSLSTRLVFYTIALLLLSSATQRASSMSLDRLGVDQNELNSALTAANNYEEKSEAFNSADIVVDDMKLEAVPTNGNTDTYLLVPAGGANGSVEKNTIENGDGAAEESLPNETSDMLMMESNDAPLRVSFLALPVEPQESMDAENVAKQEEISTEVNASANDESRVEEPLPVLIDKILEIPTESETQEIVSAAGEQMSQEFTEKEQPDSLIVEDSSNSENTIPAEQGAIAEVNADAEAEKDMEETQLAEELPNNEVPVQSEIVEDKEHTDDKKQEVIGSLSALDKDLLPETVLVPEEAVQIVHENSEENIENLHESDKLVEEANAEENEIKDDLSQQAEELISKPDNAVENVEFMQLESADEKLDAGDSEIHNEKGQNMAELQSLSENAEYTQSAENHIEESEHEIVNTKPETEEFSNKDELTKEEENELPVLLDESKSEASENEMKPLEGTVETEIDAGLTEMIAENDRDETIVEEMETNEANQEGNKPEEAITTENKQPDEAQITENDSQTAEKLQKVEEVGAVEGNQIVEESQKTEEKQTIEETQDDLDTQATEELQTVEESQTAEEAQKFEEMQTAADSNPQEAVEAVDGAEEIEQNDDKTLMDEMKQEDTVEQEIKGENMIAEAAPLKEEADAAIPENVAADAISGQEATAEDIKEDAALSEANKTEQVALEDSQQVEPIIEETQPEETLLEEIKQKQPELVGSGQQLETEQQEAINEGLQATNGIQADETEEATQNEDQQAMDEKVEEASILTESEAASEPEAQQMEVLEEITSNEKLTEEAEKQPEIVEEQEQQQMEVHQQQMLEEEQKEEEQQVADEEQIEEEQQKETEQQNVEEQQQLQQEDTQESQTVEEQQQQMDEQIGEQQQASEEPQQQIVELKEPLKEQENLENEKLQETELSEEEQQSAQEQIVELTQEETVAQTQPIIEIQQTAEEQPQPETMQPINDEPAEIVEETLNSGPIEPATSLLTTIIQVPQQQQQATPVQIANVEAPLATTLVDVNNLTAAMAAPSVAPLNVMDSVLNYVNASFMQLNNNNNNNKQQQTSQKLKDDDDDDDDLNAQLRRYDGAQVWRIVVQNDHDRKMADELQTKYGGQLWKEVKQEVDYLLKPQVLGEAEQHVRIANLSRIVLIDNLQKVIETENPSAAEIASFQNRKGHRLTWKAYHRLADIHGFFDYMAKTYPDICSVETIGYSLQKRPLKILKISNGNPGNPGIWIDGGMHAREWISPATVTFIANQLVEGWDDLPEYMRNVNWYIHAVANPDGYEYTHTTDRLWRKNMRSHGRQCPGVDLNRNFGYKWGGKGTSANPCSQTYRGSKAFSEPETFYISKFISNYPRDTFQAYLSFHSYGQYILYPWGYDYLLTADKSDLDRVARQAGTTITKKSGGKYTIGSSATTLYPAAGGSDDWAKGFVGIKYAYTIEMGDTGRYGFVLPASHIETNAKDGYTFAETVARAVTQGKYSRKRAF